MVRKEGSRERCHSLRRGGQRAALLSGLPEAVRGTHKGGQARLRRATRLFGKKNRKRAALLREAGAKQGGGGSSPEASRGTAAPVTASLRTATTAPAQRPLPNGRGGARARPSPAPWCCWWRSGSGRCSAAAPRPGRRPWRTGRSYPRRQGTAGTPRAHTDARRAATATSRSCPAPHQFKLRATSHPGASAPPPTLIGPCSRQFRRRSPSEYAVRRLSPPDWLLRRPSAYPFLTVNPPQSPPIGYGARSGGGGGVGRGVKSLFYLATVAHCELPLAAGSAAGAARRTPCLRGPAAVPGVVLLPVHRLLPPAAAGSRVAPSGDHCTFPAVGRVDLGPLRRAPSAGARRPMGAGGSRREGNRGCRYRGSSAWAAGRCPGLGKKASI